VEILEDNKHKYNVQFIDSRNNNLEFEIDLESNHWARSAKKYFVNWVIKIKGIDNDFYHEHIFNPKDMRFLISFDSKSVGDNIAWIGQVENFRVDNKCKVVCSTFHNYLFKNQYKDIEFVEPGSVVNNIHGLYRIGFFLEDGNIDYNKQPNDPKKEPLMKVAADILGIDYREVKTKLPVQKLKKRKLVSIAIHSTAQCKYWNNPTGWQDVVDFLRGEGYEVRLLSHEKNGYMGNFNPKGVVQQPKGTLLNVLNTLQESQLFIGISSGLSWLAWGAEVPTIIISGFTDKDLEPLNGISRIINKNVCNSCWSHHTFDPGNWNWCPINEGTERQFECSKTITSKEVIDEIKVLLKIE